jgi:hypothetical protein
MYISIVQATVPHSCPRVIHTHSNSPTRLQHSAYSQQSHPRPAPEASQSNRASKQLSGDDAYRRHSRSAPSNGSPPKQGTQASLVLWPLAEHRQRREQPQLSGPRIPLILTTPSGATACFVRVNLTAYTSVTSPLQLFQVRCRSYWPFCGSPPLRESRLAAAQALYIAFRVWRYGFRRLEVVAPRDDRLA